MTSACYILVFFRTEDLLGWSSSGPLPKRFQLLWVRTVDPDRALDDPGAIHLWLEEIDDANLPSGVPRAYRCLIRRRSRGRWRRRASRS